jgi:hypothetical protein
VVEVVDGSGITCHKKLECADDVRDDGVFWEEVFVVRTGPRGRPVERETAAAIATGEQVCTILLIFTLKVMYIARAASIVQ